MRRPQRTRRESAGTPFAAVRAPLPGTFEEALAARTRSSGLVAAAVGVTLFPLWTGLDRIFVPDRADTFLCARLIAVTAVVLLRLVMIRCPRSRPAAIAGAFAAAALLQACIVWMMPQAREGVIGYLLGCTVVIYGTAAVMEWHWGWMIAVNAFSALALIVSITFSGLALTPRETALAVSFLGTAAAVSTLGQGMRFQAARREFRALRAAQEARAEAEALRARNLELLAEVHRLSREDPLTGVANRSAFDQMLRETVTTAEEHGLRIGLIMLDLDGFTQLNDVHGHQAGDDVLRGVGDCLRATARAAVAARYGGEEFAVLVGGATPAELLAIAEDLRGRIAAGSRAAGRAVTASAGAAVLGVHATSADGLVAAAGAALDLAKAAGRDAAVLARTPSDPVRGAADPPVLAPGVPT